MFQPQRPSRSAVSAFSAALLFVIAAGFVAAPRAQAQTVATGNHLENKKIGFAGLSIDIPQPYVPYVAPATTTPDAAPADSDWLTPADLAKSRATILNSGKGYTNSEMFVYACGDRGLALLLSQIPNRLPSLKEKKQYLGLLETLTNSTAASSEGIVVKDVRQVGEVHVGRVGVFVKGNFIVTSFVLVPPSTILTVVGTSPAIEKDAILTDLDAAFGTLSITAKKKP